MEKRWFSIIVYRSGVHNEQRGERAFLLSKAFDIAKVYVLNGILAAAKAIRLSDEIIVSNMHLHLIALHIQKLARNRGDLSTWSATWCLFLSMHAIIFFTVCVPVDECPIAFKSSWEVEKDMGFKLFFPISCKYYQMQTLLALIFQLFKSHLMKFVKIYSHAVRVV